MKNADQPVSPVIMSHNENGYDGFKSGLTKRELFAAMAMQGLLSACNGTGHTIQDSHHLAEMSVQFADILLQKLEL